MNNNSQCNNNFEHGKKEVVDNALNTLERLTSLRDAELDIIKAMIREDWRCETCADSDNCWAFQNSLDSCACSDWRQQPRKGEEK